MSKMADAWRIPKRGVPPTWPQAESVQQRKDRECREREEEGLSRTEGIRLKGHRPRGTTGKSNRDRRNHGTGRRFVDEAAHDEQVRMHSEAQRTAEQASAGFRFAANRAMLSEQRHVKQARKSFEEQMVERDGEMVDLEVKKNQLEDELVVRTNQRDRSVSLGKALAREAATYATTSASVGSAVGSAPIGPATKGQADWMGGKRGLSQHLSIMRTFDRSLDMNKAPPGYSRPGPTPTELACLDIVNHRPPTNLNRLSSEGRQQYGETYRGFTSSSIRAPRPELPAAAVSSHSPTQPPPAPVAETGVSTAPQLASAEQAASSGGGSILANFMPARMFGGRQPGFVFKRGELGLGYYRDGASAPSEAEASGAD